MAAWRRIAHRGASGHAPEHSAAAFRKAVEFGAEMVELDVHLTRDGCLAVIHDHEVNRTTSGTGPTRGFSLAELQQLDAGSWFGAQFAGERVLGLDEVVGLLPGHVALNVEVKATEADWRALAAELSSLLVATHRVENTVVSSFALGALQAVRAVSSQLRLGVLTHLPEYGDAFRECEELAAVSIHPFFPFVDRAMVEAAHERGLAVNVWTVNDEETMRSLIGVGVDGLISDYPDRLLRVAEL